MPITQTSLPESLAGGQTGHLAHSVVAYTAINDLTEALSTGDYQHGLTVNVQDFGAVGTWTGGSGADDTSAVSAAVTYLQSKGVSGTIYFPPLPSGRYYKMTSPLPNINGIRYLGASREASRIMWTTGKMLNIGSASVHSLVFQGLGLFTSSGHLIDMGTGDLYLCDFIQCRMYTSANGASLVHQNYAGTTAGNFLENRFVQCDFDRPATSTVPGFDLINANGAVNGNIWERCRAYSHNCTSTPFFRIEGTSSSTYLFNNRFISIMGEQNAGGLIHAYTVNGLTIQDCSDYDATVNYADHVFKVSTSSSSTLASKNIEIVNSGRWGGTLNAGVYDIWMPTSLTTPPRPQHVAIINPAVFPGSPKMQLPGWRTVVIGDNGSDLSAVTLATSDTIRTGRDTTGNRPAASTAGVSAMFYDTTLGKPIWSNGTVWKDASGTTV